MTVVPPSRSTSPQARLRSELEQIVYETPPYIACLVDAFLTEERFEPYQTVFVLGERLLRHVAVIHAAALGVEAPTGKTTECATVRGTVSYEEVRNKPAIFLNQRKADLSSSAIMGAYRTTKLDEVLAAADVLREARNERAHPRTRQHELFDAVANFVTASREILVLPVFCAGPIEVVDAQRREQLLLEFRGFGHPRRRRRKLGNEGELPYCDRCFTVVPRAGVEQGGWLIDLHPWIARVLAHDENIIEARSTRIGLWCPPGHEATDARDDAYNVADDEVARAWSLAARSVGIRSPVPVSEGWLRTQLREDPSVVAELRSRGFEDVAVVGQGAFSVVYKAKHALAAEEVAVKVFLPTALLRPGEVERITREINHVNAISERGRNSVVHYPDFDGSRQLEPGRLRWVTMNYVPGRTLDVWLRENPKDSDVSARLVKELVAAVATLHRAGVVHRDLHPGNLMVRPTSDGPKIVVLDLGLAKIPRPQHGTRASTSIGWLGFGVLPYAAPEQRNVAIGEASERLREPRIDVHALGWLALALLTHEAVGPEQSREELFTQVPREWSRWVPLFDACTRPDAVGRPRDAAEVLHALMRLKGDTAQNRLGVFLPGGGFALGALEGLGAEVFEVDPPPPFIARRGWAVFMRGDERVEEYREARVALEAEGVPLCSVLALASLEERVAVGEACAMVVTVDAAEAYVPLPTYVAAPRSLARTATVFSNVFDLLLRLARSNANVSVKAEWILVHQKLDDLRVLTFALGTPRDGSNAAAVVAALSQLLPLDRVEDEAQAVPSVSDDQSHPNHDVGEQEVRNISRRLDDVAGAVRGLAAVLDGDLPIEAATDEAVLCDLRHARTFMRDRPVEVFGVRELIDAELRQRYDDDVAEWERQRDEYDLARENARIEHDRMQAALREEHEARRSAGERVDLFEETEFFFDEFKARHPHESEGNYTLKEDEPFERTTITLVCNGLKDAFAASSPRPQLPIDLVHALEQSAAPSSAFERRDALTKIYAGAWFLALLHKSEAETVRTLEQVAREAPWWRPRQQLLTLLELARHAEPSTHDDVPPLLKVVRDLVGRFDAHGVSVASPPSGEPSDDDLIEHARAFIHGNLQGFWLSARGKRANHSVAGEKTSTLPSSFFQKRGESWTWVNAVDLADGSLRGHVGLPPLLMLRTVQLRSSSLVKV